jgi:hypothetical protein
MPEPARRRTKRPTVETVEGNHLDPQASGLVNLAKPGKEIPQVAQGPTHHQRGMEKLSFEASPI